MDQDNIRGSDCVNGTEEEAGSVWRIIRPQCGKYEKGKERDTHTHTDIVQCKEGLIKFSEIPWP